MTFEKLLAITGALNKHFPQGNHPFQIMTRMLAEGGELVQTVNQFEGTGRKAEQ